LRIFLSLRWAIGLIDPGSAFLVFEVKFMEKLAGLMASYKSYHNHSINVYTHFIGVPLVSFSVFLFLAWFRFVAPSFPISLAMIFFGGSMVHYFRLDREIATYIFLTFGPLLVLAEICARLTFSTSFSVFLSTFIVGWIFQLVGHYFEGKRPALVDNFFQIFNAPAFIVCEALWMLGRRKELQDAVTNISQPTAV